MPIRIFPAPRAALFLALLLAPADIARGEGAGPQVAEVVTFRLAAGTTEAGFLAAARATGPVAAAQPGYLGRHLSRGDDGSWTDHVLWQSRGAAEAAAAAVMTDPAFAPFMAAIDPASVTLRHEEIVPVEGP